jgi:hypothetical protein
MAPSKNLPSALTRDTLKNDLHFFNLRLRAIHESPAVCRAAKAALSAPPPLWLKVAAVYSSLYFSLFPADLSQTSAPYLNLRFAANMPGHEKPLPGLHEKS